MRTPTVKIEHDQAVPAFEPLPWPAYSNLQVIAGRPLPMLSQTPEIKAILREGISMIINDITFKDAFPNDSMRGKLTRKMVKEAVRKLGFKDVVLRVQQCSEYAEALANVVSSYSTSLLLTVNARHA